MANIKRIVSSLGIAAMVLGPLAPGLSPLGGDAAYAKGGNGNGGASGGDHGNSDNAHGGKAGGNGAATKSASASTTPSAHGKLASELKGLNAANASPTALANASPNSQVGRIAAYRDAALETQGAEAAITQAETDLTAAQADLAALGSSYTGRSTTDIDTDIAALDPTATDYQASLDALNAERTAAAEYEAEQALKTTAVAEAEAALIAAQEAAAAAAATEDDALLAAADGRSLSPEAIAYLRSKLGL